jgi:hypothetical protein
LSKEDGLEDSYGYDVMFSFVCWHSFFPNGVSVLVLLRDSLVYKSLAIKIRMLLLLKRLSGRPKFPSLNTFSSPL